MGLLLGSAPALLFGGGCKDDGESGSSSPVSMFPPATLEPDDPEQIEAITGASAPQVFNLGYIGVTMAAIENGEVCSTVDGVEMCMPLGNGCPSTTETSDGFVVEGGCTTDDGAVWSGRIVAKGVSLSDEGGGAAPGATATIEYDELSIEQMSDCPDASAPSTITLDGQLEMTPDGEDAFEFELTLEVGASGIADDCSDLADASGAYEYSGRRREAGTQQIWNGRGELGSSSMGSYEAETVDEVLDSSACSYEALSGTTTITAGDDVVVITYDGATDCDEASTVSWAFNGTEQGELEGVRCGVGPVRSPPVSWGALGLFVLLLAARRRARRGSGTGMGMGTGTGTEERGPLTGSRS